MSFLDSVTVLVLTFNEAANIGRTLGKLTWARRILVIDSGSTDETLAIVQRARQAVVHQRAFDHFAGQCNFGLSLVETEWVLSLDADYELSEDLVEALHRLEPDSSVDGYRASFVYRINGHPLRGTLYPPRTVLFRRDGACYVNEGHGHRVVIGGPVQGMTGVIYHDDRKPLARWFQAQTRYAAQEAAYLLSTDPSLLRRRDRIRRMGWPAPIAVFLYTLLAKGCLLDGWPGWLYVLQRTIAEAMIAIEVVERRLEVRSDVG